MALCRLDAIVTKQIARRLVARVVGRIGAHVVKVEPSIASFMAGAAVAAALRRVEVVAQHQACEPLAVAVGKQCACNDNDTMPRLARADALGQVGQLAGNDNPRRLLRLRRVQIRYPLMMSCSVTRRVSAGRWPLI